MAVLSNNLEVAARCYERIPDVDPKFIPAYAYLSYIYSSQDESAAALSYLKRALELDPENVRIKDMLKQMNGQGN